MSKMVVLLTNNTTFLFDMLRTDYLYLSLPSPQSDHVLFFHLSGQEQFLYNSGDKNKNVVHPP